MDKCDFCGSDLSVGNSYEIILKTFDSNPSLCKRYHPWCARMEKELKEIRKQLSNKIGMDK